MLKNNFNKVIIQLITYNSERFLPFLLPSIINQTYAAFELLIIDNNSTDKTVTFLKEQYPRWQIINNNQNLGFAKAHNQLINWHKGEYILFLNHDVILDKNYLERAVNFLDKHPKVAAVGGKVLRWDYTNNQQTKIIDSCGLTIFKNGRAIDRGAGEEDVGQYNLAEEIFGLSGAVFLARRTALESIAVPNGLTKEYFDQDFVSYKEDVDLMYRFRLAGWQIWYNPQILAWHERALKTGADLLAERKKRKGLYNFYSYRNHLAVLLKNESWSNLFKRSLFIFWYEFKKFGWLLIFETSTLKGLIDFVKKLPLWLNKRKYIQTKIKKINNQELLRWYK